MAVAERRIAVKNPVTDNVIGEIEVTPPETLREMVERARNAQRLWQATTVKGRVEVLRRFGDLLWEHQREAMDTIRAETGKNDAGAFIEIVTLDGAINWTYHNAPQVLAPERRAAALPFLQYGRVYHKPHGVVGFITPWNYPLFLAMVDAIAALAAGNAVIIKPSEVTPYSALYAADLMERAGLPRYIFQVATGDGSTGAALVDLVDYISFTGSTATGKKVAEQAARRLIPYSMELGGKDAMVVLKDANIDLAASAAIQGGLENAGQMCISVERIYVEEPAYEPFINTLREQLNGLVIGAGSGFDVHVGSMTNGRELERTEQHIADAVAKGAELIYGGKRRPDLGPLFFEPAVLANVDHSMEVMREETFGPILPVMKVSNEVEAVRLANDSPYGLSGSIFTTNLPKGEHLALQLNTGDVGVNRTSAAAGSPAMPWGGQKDSGVGRRGGREGLLRFTTSQSVVVDRQIGQKPGLILLDDTTRSLLQILRTIRRYVPFI